MSITSITTTVGKAAVAAALLVAGFAPAATSAPVTTGASAPEATPVTRDAAVTGSIRVPLDRSDPGGPTISIAYALVPHRDQTAPAVGTVVPNPGGPGGAAVEMASFYTEMLAPLLPDHDLLLIDPRGTGGSTSLSCGLADLPPTRGDLTRAIGTCGRALENRARGFTSAATADDMDAVRAHLGIPRLDLLGDSYGTYLMTVYAQRHPDHVRSVVLSSAYPLAFDQWGRSNARAVSRAVQLMCERSDGSCRGERVLSQVARLARRLRVEPISYRVKGEPEDRILDETALAGIAYAAGEQLGQLPAVVRAALGGDNGPLVAAAQAIRPFSGSSASATESDLALGVSVMCNDYPTLWDRHASIGVRLEQYAARRASLPAKAFYPFSKRAWTSAIVDRGNTCIRWSDRNAPVQRTDGPFADVPVLVLSGDLDANTPTREGRQAARQFRDARVIEVPNVAHVPESSSPCAAAILADFIRHLEVGDVSCLADIPPIPVA